MKKLPAVLGLVGFCAAAHAQTASHSVLDGVYTTAQADRGLQLFAANCAKCHELGLTSSATISPLGGEDFRSDYAGQTVADMEGRIQNTMPADNPGKLSPAEATDLAAFILRNNHVPPGTTELSPDPQAQSQLKIEFPKPD